MFDEKEKTSGVENFYEQANKRFQLVYNEAKKIPPPKPEALKELREQLSLILQKSRITNV